MAAGAGRGLSVAQLLGCLWLRRSQMEDLRVINSVTRTRIPKPKNHKS